MLQDSIYGPASARTMDQLERVASGARIKFDRGDEQKINEDFPGHKTAPEDYAW